MRPVTHSGMETSSFIHGQESVAVDPFDANDPLRNCKELQDTWAGKRADSGDWWFTEGRFKQEKGQRSLT